MAERFFARETKLKDAGRFMTDLQDNQGVVKSTITTTAVGLGAQPYIVFTFTNDIPVVDTAGGATVEYEYDTSEPTWSTLVEVTDGDHASGYTLEIITSAVDMGTVGTFDVDYTATDASGNISETHSVTITIVDTTIPVITLTSATDDVDTFDAPTWDGGVANMASAIDGHDGDVSSSVVITYKKDTSGGDALATLADARTYLGVAAQAVYCAYNVDDASSNSAVEKTYTVTAID